MDKPVNIPIQKIEFLTRCRYGRSRFNIAPNDTVLGKSERTIMITCPACEKGAKTHPDKNHPVAKLKLRARQATAFLIDRNTAKADPAIMKSIFWYWFFRPKLWWVMLNLPLLVVMFCIYIGFSLDTHFASILPFPHLFLNPRGEGTFILLLFFMIGSTLMLSVPTHIIACLMLIRKKEEYFLILRNRNFPFFKYPDNSKVANIITDITFYTTDEKFEPHDWKIMYCEDYDFDHQNFGRKGDTSQHREMSLCIEREFAKRGRVWTDSGNLIEYFSKDSAEDSSKIKSIHFCGMDITVYHDINAFRKGAIENGRAAILLNKRYSYESIMRSLFGCIDDTAGENSLKRAVTAGPVVCFNCLNELSGVQLLEGITKDGFVITWCPKCFSNKILYVYLAPETQNITIDHVRMLKAYSRHHARLYWERHPGYSKIPDACGQTIRRGHGFSFFNGDICCDQCFQKSWISDEETLKNIQKFPYYFGVGTLDRAKEWSKSHQGEFRQLCAELGYCKPSIGSPKKGEGSITAAKGFKVGENGKLVTWGDGHQAVFSDLPDWQVKFLLENSKLELPHNLDSEAIWEIISSLSAQIVMKNMLYDNSELDNDSIMGLAAMKIALWYAIEKNTNLENAKQTIKNLVDS